MLMQPNTHHVMTISNFDVAKYTSCNDHLGRFYYGSVLRLMVRLQDKFEITSNRESGCGSYGIVLKPYDKEEYNVYIIDSYRFSSICIRAFATVSSSVLSYEDLKTFNSTLHANGFTPRQVIEYGFAFHGKTCLIGK